MMFRSSFRRLFQWSLCGTFLLLGGALLAFSLTSNPPLDQEGGNEERVELGRVDWHEGLEEACQKAQSSGKPIFLLFTEVPGCATVKGYGKNVLGHPQVADAIEEAFVPAVVYNNKKGEHRRLLKSFDEPTWNNPAVRIIRPDREMLVPRLYGDYSVGATVRTMVKALKEADREVPLYLELLDRQYNRDDTDTAIFSMYCYWSGEAKIGSLPSVRSTRPGFIAGTEGVEAIFDPRRTSLEDLAQKVLNSGAADRFHARDEEQFKRVSSTLSESKVSYDPSSSFHYKPGEDDHQLQGSPYAELELHEIQKTRVNSAIGLGEDPDRFLSPSQERAVP